MKFAFVCAHLDSLVSDILAQAPQRLPLQEFLDCADITIGEWSNFEVRIVAKQRSHQNWYLQHFIEPEHIDELGIVAQSQQSVSEIACSVGLLVHRSACPIRRA